MNRLVLDKRACGSQLANRRQLIWTLVLVPFFRPNGLYAIWHPGQYLYDLFLMISFSIILVHLIRERKQPGKLALVQSVLFLELFIPTAAFSQDVLFLLRVAVTTVAVVLSVQALSDSPEALFGASRLNLEVLIYLNAISMIVFPDGMFLSHGDIESSTNWPIGYDNYWFVFYYAALFIASIYLIDKRDRIRSRCLIITGYGTSFATRSGVLVVGWILMGFLYATNLYRMKRFSFTGVLVVSKITTILGVTLLPTPAFQSFLNTISKTGNMNA